MGGWEGAVRALWASARTAGLVRKNNCVFMAKKQEGKGWGFNPKCVNLFQVGQWLQTRGKHIKPLLGKRSLFYL